MWERVWLGVILPMCMYAACMAVRVSIDMGIQIPCKDFINTYRNNLFPAK